jgi:hypothetical protein
MLEKVKRIREAAVLKSTRDGRRDPEHLATELQRTRVEMGRLQEELDGYRELAAETEARLLDLQERCDTRQAMMLGTLVGWFMNQLKLREKK